MLNNTLENEKEVLSKKTVSWLQPELLTGMNKWNSNDLIYTCWESDPVLCTEVFHFLEETLKWGVYCLSSEYYGEDQSVLDFYEHNCVRGAEVSFQMI